ncbi:MAG: hypothetical protein R6X02_04695 [Enhygromyxa sp.]
MALVQLITTGVMEERALGASLRRLFPDHEFICKPHLDGFTSAPLPPQPHPRAPLNLDKFAKTLIGVFDPGNRRDRPRPDFLIGIDDVELCNADDPSRITASLRQILERRLAEWPGNARSVDRLRDDLLEKVSFHVMAPMTEAYFFADATALSRSTAPALDRPNRFDLAACDVESFEVLDPDYLDAPPDPTCRWRRSGPRQGHPKRYLSYLTDPGTGSRYRESDHGVRALAELEWPTVTRDSQRTRFARSLLADLVDMLGAPAKDINDGETHPLTWPPPADRVLRNL